MVRIDSLSSVPPHIQPPIAHVPCAIRETFISVPEITVYSICFILCYEMGSATASSPTRLSFGCRAAVNIGKHVDSHVQLVRPHLEGNCRAPRMRAFPRNTRAEWVPICPADYRVS